MPGKKESLEKLDDLKEYEEERIKFSFALADFNGDRDFDPSRANESNIFTRVLESMRDVCKLTLRQLRFEQHNRFKFHLIKWEETSKTGFRIGEQYEAYKPYQIEFTGQGRFHGFFYEDHIFFVIWCDPFHKLYPIQDRGKNRR